LPFCGHRLLAPKPADPARPKEIRTLGDRLRTRRLDLGLLQRGVAERLGVSEASVWQWENNRTGPQIRFLPAILAFLGENPYPEPSTFAEWVRARRRALGFSRRRLAAELGVDESSVFRWESGQGSPLAHLRGRLRAVLGWPPP
jgi:transcriptional regulator with XRE-family HTH domain